MDLADTCDVAALWHDATAAWISVSHLRFGPTEADNRSFALSYWPDPRNATPRALTALLRDDAPAIADASIAGRGFYAMEFLLFDPAFAGVDGRCDLIADLARDSHSMALAIDGDWQERYANLMRDAAAGTVNDTYHNEAEVLQELYKATITGLEFTIDMRLGRPLGTFDNPRPLRTEMHRSARALDNIALSLKSTGELAAILSNDALAEEIFGRVSDIQEQIALISQRDGGPDLSLVDRPREHVVIEGLQVCIMKLHDLLVEYLGPDLGVIEGFNATDGD